MDRALHNRFKVLTALAATGWTLAIALSVLWQVSVQRWETVELARSEARAAFEKDVLFRAWNAGLGGLYAPAEGTQPNPWLEVAHRDLETAIGTLTLVNPAYMTRMVHELGAERSGLLGHITSLDPINPENAPDPWERGALEAFDTGVTEVSEVRMIGDAEHLRYMRPLYVEEACLTCHEQQGYEIGDVRGGISVAVPVAPISAITGSSAMVSTVAHGGIWLLGLAGIVCAARVRRRLLSRVEQARDTARRAREKAERANRAKSEFLATMSHELRTPLNAIMGFSEVIRDRIMGPVGVEAYADYARDIHDSGAHLLSLINDVLDLARIESGKTELEFEAIDLAWELAACRRLVAGRAEARGLTLSCADVRGLRLSADPRAFKQIMVNLLSNAVKFTPPGGHIRLDAEQVQDAVRVKVSDNGCGIAAHDLGRIVLPFERASNAYVKSGDGGTGLGLALVRQLMQLHGGDLAIDSRSGEGTTVTLTFPACAATRPVAGISAEAVDRQYPLDNGQSRPFAAAE
ncbi:MAG: DUF3365 domain-containing protein [Alphaproteobacteria bacterium]|jgi:signal transduction histidine kinase|nr:DUF3365 domain-containing protein [Alphaproteobacteria bacterium]